MGCRTVCTWRDAQAYGLRIFICEEQWGRTLEMKMMNERGKKYVKPLYFFSLS